MALLYRGLSANVPIQGDGLHHNNLNGGMWDDQINKAMHKYKTYLGTISRDEMHNIFPHVQPQSQGSFIMNLEPHTHPNDGHWVAIYYDARPHGSHSIEYYDPLGDRIPPDIQRQMKILSGLLRSDEYLKLKDNTIKFQSDTSSDCGEFSIKFLVDRYRGIPFPECTGFDDHVQGQKDIKAFKAKFKPFQYI